MIQMPLNDIIAKIVDGSDLSTDDVNEKIKQKTDQLAGLISKEGAAHIIANELGVKLFEASGKHKVDDLFAGMRDIEVVAKATQVYEVKEFETSNRKGKLASMIVGDESGTIRTVVWGDQADEVAKIQPNTVLKIEGAYIRENQGRLEMHLNDRSKLTISPEGETIGEVKVSVPKKADSVRKKIKDLVETDNGVELLGTIVQVFDIKFFEICPQCGKRARERGDGQFYCENHDAVTPDLSYVTNVFLDDGSESIRIAFFRDQAKTLLGKDNDEIISFKASPEKYEEAKNNLLGNMIKVSGRASKNSMFDRLEFVANSVSTNVNPEEEIGKLKQEVEEEKSLQ